MSRGKDYRRVELEKRALQALNLAKKNKDRNKKLALSAFRLYKSMKERLDKEWY